MLYITCPGLFYCVTRSLYLLTPFTYFAHPQPPISGNHQSLLCIYDFVGFCLLLVENLLLIHHKTLTRQHPSPCLRAGLPGWESDLTLVAVGFWASHLTSYVPQVSRL